MHIFLFVSMKKFLSSLSDWVKTGDSGLKLIFHESLIQLFSSYTVHFHSNPFVMEITK
jgi:hypothetical protein